MTKFKNSGYLSIGLGTGMSSIFSETVKNFLKKIDIPSVNIKEDSLCDLSIMLQKNEIDFMIVPVYKTDNSYDFIYKTIIKDNIIGITKKETTHLIDHTISIGNLKNKTIILYDSTYHVGNELFKYAPNLLNDNKIIKSDNWAFILNLVNDLDAIAFVPSIIKGNKELKNFQTNNISPSIDGEIMMVYKKGLQNQDIYFDFAKNFKKDYLKMIKI